MALFTKLPEPEAELELALALARVLDPVSFAARLGCSAASLKLQLAEFEPLRRSMWCSEPEPAPALERGPTHVPLRCISNTATSAPPPPLPLLPL